MANIVAMFHSALHMDDGYVNHIAIVQDVDGYHNHFLYDEDKGKGAAGTGPFKTIEDAKQDVIAHYPDAKEKKISPAGYRYYSTQRPIMPGGYPKPKNNEVLEIENFDNKKFVEEVGCQAWGYIEYKKPLGHFDVINYELAAVKIKTLHLKYIGRDDPLVPFSPFFQHFPICKQLSCFFIPVQFRRLFAGIFFIHPARLPLPVNTQL